MAVTFEGYERRIDQIMPVLNKYGIKRFRRSKKKFVKTKDSIQLKWLNQFNQYVLIMLVGLTQ